jgi:Tfp pilus assembly major pilin PilA
MTPDEQRRADYVAAIGPNTGYYLKHFEDLDAGGPKVGWHWPAFFVTTFWFAYRKMWLPALLNFFWPVISFVIGAVLVAVLGVPAGVVIYLLLLLAPSILLPMFANAIYRHHVHRLIAGLRPDIAASSEQRAARLERDGGASAGAVAGAVAVGFFVYVFILGILAAIAIPAYQDYTLRAQVVEGLNLAVPVKTRVAEYRQRNGEWPDQADLGDEMPHGKFVESVGVAAGSVVIRYGNEANEKLARLRIALTPARKADGEIVWACGNAPRVPDAEPAAGPAGSDVPNKYLPASCRGE